MRRPLSPTRIALSLATAGCLALTLLPVTAAPASAAYCDPAASGSPPAAGGDAARLAVACLINAERTQRGLQPLTSNPSLTAAAQQHTAAAVQLKWWGPGKDSHTNPQTGSTPQSRIKAAGYCQNPRSWAVSEITYTGWGGSGTPKAAVTWWMNSPTHRSIILDGSLREYGSWAQAGAADRAGAGASGAGTYVVTFGRCQQ
ncbi:MULTISPECIES: CAP domain-containing protein [Streptomyces]|uniref:CAP domain-containing protein n=1 Tax=Streptomyces TaxID=1883 RepID=UPI000AC49309|nr:CAP domain-containing protein [Streptomyces katrae]